MRALWKELTQLLKDLRPLILKYVLAIFFALILKISAQIGPLVLLFLFAFESELVEVKQGTRVIHLLLATGALLAVVFGANFLERWLNGQISAAGISRGWKSGRNRKMASALWLLGASALEGLLSLVILYVEPILFIAIAVASWPVTLVALWLASQRPLIENSNLIVPLFRAFPQASSLILVLIGLYLFIEFPGVGLVTLSGALLAFRFVKMQQFQRLRVVLASK